MSTDFCSLPYSKSAFMKQTILITGANRGLGLEFVRQYAKADTIIHACCRSPQEAHALQALQQTYPQIQIHALDVTSSSDMHALKNKIIDPIDILINNAGMLERDPPFGQLSVDYLNHTFQVNAVAPLKILEAFKDHLAQSQHKLAACVTSRMGSIHDNTSGGYYSYRAAKAALNMLMKSAAYDLQSSGIKVLLLHPGWVQTRMGGEDAPITPEQSITGMRKVIENYAPPAGEAQFYSYQGESIPW